MADVTGPIIGSYYLSYYNLLVDVRRRRLNDITTLTFNGDPAGTSGGQFEVLAGSSSYLTTLLDFPEIIRPADVYREPRHSTVHHTWTTSRFTTAAAKTGSHPDR